MAPPVAPKNLGCGPRVEVVFLHNSPHIAESASGRRCVRCLATSAAGTRKPWRLVGCRWRNACRPPGECMVPGPKFLTNPPPSVLRVPESYACYMFLLVRRKSTKSSAREADRRRRRPRLWQRGGGRRRRLRRCCCRRRSTHPRYGGRCGRGKRWRVGQCRLVTLARTARTAPPVRQPGAGLQEGPPTTMPAAPVAACAGWPVCKWLGGSALLVQTTGGMAVGGGFIAAGGSAAGGAGLPATFRGGCCAR